MRTTGTVVWLIVLISSASELLAQQSRFSLAETHLVDHRLTLISFGWPASEWNQAPSETSQAYGRAYSSRRLYAGLGSLLAADVAVMVGLNRLWYRDYDRGHFRFHNDWNNWAFQDKFGHLFVAYQLARVSGRYGQWSGLSDGRSAWLGGAVSWLFQLQIEIMDGFSEGWGFSNGDLLFNTVGSGLGTLQIARPEIDWFALKYSYRRSPFADTDIGWGGNAIKDYSGMSFWLVVRPNWLDESAWWPRWLALSIGHSADNLASARSTPEFPHRRQLFVGPDLDLLKSIDWPEPWMKTVAGLLSFVRLPAPVLELTPTMKWHWLYY